MMSAAANFHHESTVLMSAEVVMRIRRASKLKWREFRCFEKWRKFYKCFKVAFLFYCCKMPSQSSGISFSDNMARFSHILQPIRDLTKNWDIDVATQLEEYLSEV